MTFIEMYIILAPPLLILGGIALIAPIIEKASRKW